MLKRTLFAAWLLLASVAAPAAPEPALTLTLGGESHTFLASQLLSRADASEVRVARDVSYGTPRTYRGVPLAGLLGKAAQRPDTVLEARATDGFVAQLPMDLVSNRDPASAVAWLAIEDPANPWPKLPGKNVSAGPFYLVWTGAQAASVRGEQWPYQIAALTVQASPVTRWPALAVDASVPANDPVRAGQRIFVTICFACHRLNGAGGGEVGPDLNLPMNPTEYFQPAALRQYIRDPASVRNWPQRSMPGFGTDQLSDHELDQLIAYLAYMAPRKHRP